MPEHLANFEVEVGEEDGIAMVRVSGDEGLYDNPSGTSKELNKEPLRTQMCKVPHKQCKAVQHLPLRRCPSTSNNKALV